VVSPTTVVYIGGWSRSGSTLLCRALGELDGWIAVGEVRAVWQDGILLNRACGCAAPFHECEFWRAVFEAAFGGMDSDQAAQMVKMQAKLPTWHMLAMPGVILRRRLSSRMGAYVSTLGRLYRAISEVSEARVTVDSSKFPTYAYALDSSADIDLHICHLVRDPRACTFSWARRLKKQPFGVMKSLGPVQNSLHWNQRNRVFRSIWGEDFRRYTLLRYEDFVSHPAEGIRSVRSLVEEAASVPSAPDDRQVTLGPNHMVAGNPNRFDTGRVAVRDDREWMTGLPQRDQSIVKALTFPGMRRYGYA
jgi:hypothetical protein